MYMSLGLFRDHSASRGRPWDGGAREAPLPRTFGLGACWGRGWRCPAPPSAAQFAALRVTGASPLGRRPREVHSRSTFGNDGERDSEMANHNAVVSPSPGRLVLPLDPGPSLGVHRVPHATEHRGHGGAGADRRPQHEDRDPAGHGARHCVRRGASKPLLQRLGYGGLPRRADPPAQTLVRLLHTLGGVGGLVEVR